MDRILLQLGIAKNYCYLAVGKITLFLIIMLRTLIRVFSTKSFLCCIVIAAPIVLHNPTSGSNLISNSFDEPDFCISGAGTIDSFIIDWGDGCAPLEVTFNNSSLGEPLEYLWFLGNGDSHSLTNTAPEIIYYSSDTSQTYIVTFLVSNSCGSNSITDTITVLPQEVQSLSVISEASFNPIEPACEGSPFIISNNSINDTSYKWAVLESDVTLCIDNSINHPGSAEIEILSEVIDPFSLADTQYCSTPELVMLNSTPSGGAWQSSDGKMSSIPITGTLVLMLEKMRNENKKDSLDHSDYVSWLATKLDSVSNDEYMASLFAEYADDYLQLKFEKKGQEPEYLLASVDTGDSVSLLKGHIYFLYGIILLLLGYILFSSKGKPEHFSKQKSYYSQSEFFRRIRHLTSLAELDTALEIMEHRLRLSNSRIYDEIILLQNRLNDLNRKNGLLTGEEITIARNNLAASILVLIRKIEMNPELIV